MNKIETTHNWKRTSFGHKLITTAGVSGIIHATVTVDCISLINKDQIEKETDKLAILIADKIKSDK